MGGAKKSTNVSLEIDASWTGWGAVCKGFKTGGPWSKQEQRLHINCLELPAAFLAFKCFFKNKRSIHVLQKMDNTSAIAYSNKMGGMVSLALNNIHCKQRILALVHGEGHPCTSPASGRETELNRE